MENVVWGGFFCWARHCRGIKKEMGERLWGVTREMLDKFWSIVKFYVSRLTSSNMVKGPMYLGLSFLQGKHILNSGHIQSMPGVLVAVSEGVNKACTFLDFPLRLSEGGNQTITRQSYPGVKIRPSRLGIKTVVLYPRQYHLANQSSWKKNYWRVIQPFPLIWASLSKG